MKTKFLSAILLLIFSITLHAQPWQWYEQTSGVTSQLNCVSGVPSGISRFVWICGVNGIVLRTTNSGTNWINVSGGGIPNNIPLTTICGIDSFKAMVSGTLGGVTYVYRTMNGGLNWQVIFSQASGFINAIWMTGPANSMMLGNPVGGRWSIWKTTNAGVSWDSTGLYLPQSGSETGFPNSFSRLQTNQIWFGTNNFRIYYTTNSGLNWTVQSTAPQKNSACIFFEPYGGPRGYMGGDSLMFTTNNGTNWRYSGSMGTGRFGGIHGTFLIGEGGDSLFSKTYYVRSDNKVYYKPYGQWSSWQVRYTAPNGIYTYMGRTYLFGFDVYALRNNGGITKGWIEVEGAVKKISSRIPDKFKLMQNYPNPFNPATTIKFDIPPIPLLRGVSEGRGVSVRLTIYSTLGAEIATLVNEPLSPGTYEVEWDATQYSSGVYFYKLVAEGYAGTRKMMLMK